MSLPKINTPEYKLNIPSTDEEITYRPFLVKEEKLLLIAQETGDEKAQYIAIQNLIKNCVTQEIAVDKLPMFDLEYIFLNIRAKSVGEIAKLKIICPDDEKTTVDVEVDLTKINVEMDEKHDARIQLTDNIGVLMSYPTMDLVEEHAVNDTPNPTQQLFKMVAECIFQIWEGEEVHDASDYSYTEKTDFLESLSHEQFEKIQNFFETMPTLKHEIEVTNPNTKVKSTVTLKGIQSFFG
tara:strand:+ start:292 stop:1005 length:714 start_codon:yes stop_codon:yes gene_type:complete